MNDFREAKIKMFINDPVMSEAVFDVLLETFIKQKPRSESTYHELAAERISINQLQEAWKELEKFKQIKNDEPPERGQVGL